MPSLFFADNFIELKSSRRELEETLKRNRHWQCVLTDTMEYVVKNGMRMSRPSAAARRVVPPTPPRSQQKGASGGQVSLVRVSSSLQGPPPSRGGLRYSDPDWMTDGPGEGSSSSHSLWTSDL